MTASITLAIRDLHVGYLFMCLQLHYVASYIVNQALVLFC